MMQTSEARRDIETLSAMMQSIMDHLAACPCECVQSIQMDLQHQLGKVNVEK